MGEVEGTKYQNISVSGINFIKQNICHKNIGMQIDLDTRLTDSHLTLHKVSLKYILVQEAVMIIKRL